MVVTEHIPSGDPGVPPLVGEPSLYQGNRKPRVHDGTMRFGLFWPYSGAQIPSSRLLAENPKFLDINNHMALARAIEDAGFDFTLIADGYAPSSEAGTKAGFQDPRSHGLLWALPLLGATRNLGVISTLHTNYLHPTHIARFAGHMDCLSNGRWGWNIVTGFRPAEAQLFGMDQPPDHDAAYDMAEECLDVVRALWRDEPVHHEGKYYRVNGKLAGPRPGGEPLLVCAASSSRGRDFSIRNCDYIFAPPERFEDVPEIKKDIADRSAALNLPRVPEMLVLGDLLIREAPGQAQEVYYDMSASVDAEAKKIWTQTMAKFGTWNGEILGTAREVAEQILSLREKYGLNGLLFRLMFWDAREVQYLRPMFDLLREAGVWVPPAERGHSW
jgi:FMNH2-dependent dimethyl sulfone monooxygenase